MNIALKYLTALLGLWLIIAVSVFPTGAAHWIAFATAIALTAVALGDCTVSALRRRLAAASTATATALLSGFLIIASLVLVHASVSWLMAIAGGVIEFLALSELVLPARVRVVAFNLPEDGRVTQRIERGRVAA
jgi:hypothetical protein